MIPLVLILAAPVPGAGVDIVFPTPTETLRLRVEVSVDGRPPEIDWSAFLDKLFDHFDRDGDGSLSAIEASRLFPLPLPGGRVVKMDFARVDADKNGKVSRAEFRAFYRAAGYAPVIAVIHPQTTENRRLSDVLFRHLDRDGDGTLTREELGQATALLRRFDDNEDEVLVPAELLALEPADHPLPMAKTSIQAASPAGEPDALMRAALCKQKSEVRFEAKSTRFKVGSDLTSFRFPGSFATVKAGTTEAVGGFGAAKEFYLAQYTEALSGNSELGKADLEADAGLQAIGAMFDAADRDGAGKLTLVELRAFLDLIDLGLCCQVVVSIEDRGESLFDLLDTNADGRLDLGELNRAVALAPLGRAKLPRQYRIGLARQPVASTFGPVPIPVRHPTTTKASTGRQGPRWFLAMDRNGDGFVSAAEFRGSIEQFAKLDKDGDGRISVAEAEAACKGASQ
jgi:Ca2+-binding EF-hand superfamily protein